MARSGTCLLFSFSLSLLLAFLQPYQLFPCTPNVSGWTESSGLSISSANRSLPHPYLFKKIFVSQLKHLRKAFLSCFIYSKIQMFPWIPHPIWFLHRTYHNLKLLCFLICFFVANWLLRHQFFLFYCIILIPLWAKKQKFCSPILSWTYSSWAFMPTTPWSCSYQCC